MPGKEIAVSANGYYTRLFFTGAFMNLLNPGIIAVWFSTATAFVTYTFNQRIVIFGLALLIALGADLAKVLLADKLRQKLTLRNIHRINRINGAIILLFGIVLLFYLLTDKSISH